MAIGSNGLNAGGVNRHLLNAGPITVAETRTLRVIGSLVMVQRVSENKES